MKNIQLIVNKVLELLQEVETYSFYKVQLERNLTNLFAAYQQGKFTYFEYEKTLNRLLKGKSKEEVLNYYNAYILSLLKRIETYNSQIFYEIYNDQEYMLISSRPRAPRPARKHVEKLVEKPVEHKKIISVPAPARPAEEIEEPKPLLKIEIAPMEEEKVEALPELPAEKLVEVRPSFIDRISLFFKRIFLKKQAEEELAEIELELPGGEKEKLLVERDRKKRKWFSTMWEKEKPMLPKELDEEEKPAEKVKAKEEKPVISFDQGFGIGYIKNLLSRSQKVEFADKGSEVPISTLQLETLRRKTKDEIAAQIDKITATSLTKEAKRIRSIMSKRKALKIYQPSFFGAVANVAIKQLSLFLLDQFPDFFKDLYHALRLANIKVLSNTYVNMMVLGVLTSTVLGFFLFGFIFFATALPLGQVLSRALLMSICMGAVAFAGFYAYPYSKLKQRRRNVNTNLPFAINHMAAVSSSGVAPVRMFKLIAESKEYGEVSAEIEKIVNYVDIFGYDILTALKAVAATTPAYQFKDFLEGMVSTTQTGGDIKSYFSQKAEEAMMNYKMDRQKYTETIATYSDIYTGILIAAPLFFVAALSMVSLLGGKVGGFSVNTVIVIGTYLIIPFMNVCFLVFIEMTQPEI